MLLAVRVLLTVDDDWQSYLADCAPARAALVVVAALSHDLMAVCLVVDRSLMNILAPCAAEGVVVPFGWLIPSLLVDNVVPLDLLGLGKSLVRAEFDR